MGRQHVKLTGDDGRQAEDVGEAAVDWLVRGIFQEVVTWMEGGRKKTHQKERMKKTKQRILLSVMTLKQKSEQLLLKKRPLIYSLIFKHRWVLFSSGILSRNTSKNTCFYQSFCFFKNDIFFFYHK